MYKCLLIILLLSSSLSANVDLFNTYRFNRKNVIQKNNKIDTNPWYEWWYYKIIIPESNEELLFSYGIVNPWDKENTLAGTRSFVSLGDFKNRVLVENFYNIDNFQARYDETYVEVNKHIATDKYIKGHVQSHNGDEYSWDISIQKKWAFNATSWATGKMLTNIEWYPAQASASCSGSVIRKGELLRFKDAPCYQDRNWGNSFPEWWTWIVSNQFIDSPETALVIGGGKPTFLKKINFIEGVAIGLYHKGIEYAWRPNEFAKVKMDVNFGKWEVEGKNKNYKINISAYAPKDKFMDLQFITPTGKTFHDYETLSGDLTIKLYKKVGGIFNPKWNLIETLISRHAGIEYGSKNDYEFESLFNSAESVYSNY